MGLSLCVGILSDLAEDSEGLADFRRQFDKVNRTLKQAGLPPHAEPAKLPSGSWSCDLAGYSALHALRRIAAWLWAGKGLPPAPVADADKDPLVERYLETVGRNAPRRPTGTQFRFDHLMLHSDSEGFYVPIEFPNVLFASRAAGLAGGLIGSSAMLKNECEVLAGALALPLDLDPASEEVVTAADSGGPGWRLYGQEAHSCLALHKAAEVSLKTGAAIVFT